MKKAFKMAALVVVAASLMTACNNGSKNAENADTLSEEQLQAQEYLKTTDSLKNAETAQLQKYVADNNITVSPKEDGLYVVVNKMGKGAKVAAGKHVKIHYTGTLLDGTVFDSSEQREPLEYTVGEMGLIKGWEEAIDGMPAGSEITAIMPSTLAYGEQGTPGGPIKPFSPLRFDLKIIEVK